MRTLESQLNHWSACLAFILIWCTCGCGDEAQRVDLTADVTVENPAYPKGKGPRVVIDGAHANFHTASGRYQPLANLLRNDGFIVEENKQLISDSTLTSIDILVIANANVNADRQSFLPKEIDALHQFVHQGGSLLLIADHAPFPGAIIDLARAFSIQFEDVFADDEESGIFTKDNGDLTNDPLLDGINQIRTFGGSAFRIDSVEHRPLFVMGDHWTMQHMEANGLSEKASAAGYYQAAVLHVGSGKMAVFGEAAMFSAQTYGKGKKRMGFHAHGAKDNKQFIRNVFHWLGEPQR